jgi:ferrous-iron efflux pump FieF
MPYRLALPTDPDRLNRLAVTASVVTAGVLIVLKLVLWLLTGSVTLLASLIDSGVDVLASLIALLTLRQAVQPPDRAHRFGHGKAEPLGALLQAAFLAGLALMVTFQAVQRLIEPVPIRYGGAAIAAMVVAVVLTVLLVTFQRTVVRRTGSVAVAADSWHYRSDIISNLAALAGLVLVEATGLSWIDPLVAFTIVAALLAGATGIGRRSLDMLMDRELPQEERSRILALALAHPEARGAHDLRTRRAGSNVFIEMHLELDGSLPLRRAHDIAHEVEDRIRAAFPGADIVVHQEPSGLVDERLDEAIRSLARG